VCDKRAAEVVDLFLEAARQTAGVSQPEGALPDHAAAIAGGVGAVAAAGSDEEEVLFAEQPAVRLHCQQVQEV
jgi:hypothetical protein